VPKLVKNDASFEDFLAEHDWLYEDERRYGRSLFGAHLDDIAITFEDKKSKSFASRGQQKLIVLLVKIAQMRQLMVQKGSGIFLLDDFMTDFDEHRAANALNALMDLKMQLVITSPAKLGVLEGMVVNRGAQRILLTP
jgi:DNA replication and repair protein RecF